MKTYAALGLLVSMLGVGSALGQAPREFHFQGYTNDQRERTTAADDHAIPFKIDFTSDAFFYQEFDNGKPTLTVRARRSDLGSCSFNGNSVSLQAAQGRKSISVDDRFYGTVSEKSYAEIYVDVETFKIIAAMISNPPDTEVPPAPPVARAEPAPRALPPAPPPVAEVRPPAAPSGVPERVRSNLAEYDKAVDELARIAPDQEVQSARREKQEFLESIRTNSFAANLAQATSNRMTDTVREKIRDTDLTRKGVEIHISVTNGRHSPRKNVGNLLVTVYFRYKGEVIAKNGVTDAYGATTVTIPAVTRRDSPEVVVEAGYISDAWRAPKLYVDNSGANVAITYDGINPNWITQGDPLR